MLKKITLSIFAPVLLLLGSASYHPAQATHWRIYVGPPVYTYPYAYPYSYPYYYYDYPYAYPYYGSPYYNFGWGHGWYDHDWHEWHEHHEHHHHH